jgi:hypothetical protein
MNMSERGHEGLSDGDFLNCMFFQVEQLVAVRLRSGTLPVCCCDAICLCDTSICQDRLGTRQPTAMVVVFSLLFLSSFAQDGWHSFLLMIRYGVGE